MCAGLALAGLMLGQASFSQDSNTQKRGRKYKVPPPTSRIEITILKDVNGKPIENASVIFHPMENGRDAGNMELKTNEDGKAVIDVIETGATVRLQVIAKGYQTYGQDYQIDKDQVAIEVRMKRPGEQYSIYKPHDIDAQKQDTKDKPAPADSSKPN